MQMTENTAISDATGMQVDEFKIKRPRYSFTIVQDQGF